jgi:hypothetical protein
MSQFLIANIYKNKRINDSRYHLNFQEESYQLCSNDYDNAESEIIKSNNPFEFEIIFEDINREKEYHHINNFSTINPLNINNNAEHNNISSMNTTNENKIFDYISKAPLFPKCYIDVAKKKKIFEIAKVNKRLGRLKKNSVISGKHSKLAEDNIIRKIKRRFIENLRIYINKEYKNYRAEMNKSTNRKNWLKKVDPKFSCTIKRNDNLKWFNSKVFEIFSDNLSLKYSSQNLNSNKRKIQRILAINESNSLKDILNTTIDALYTRYVTNQSLNEFKILDEDLNDLENQMKKSGQENIDEYLSKYKDIAINLKSIFLNKSDRNRKKK